MSTSQSEDIVIVESSDYAQVIFDDVQEFYTNSKPLVCRFNLNELLKNKIESNDWIGIYKVGFSSCLEFCCNLQINEEAGSKGKIMFPIEVLPKEDTEFYQFVYVTNGKQIRGASVPFQFKTEEFSGYSDDEDQDAIIVKFENDTITEVKNKCVQLSSDNRKYEKLIKENEQVIKSLKDEVASIKLRCFRLTMDNEKLNFTLRNKADSLKNLAETISTLTSDNKNLQLNFENLFSDNKHLLDTLQKRIDQVAMLKKELESVKIKKDDFEEVLSLKETELLRLETDKDELTRIAEELNQINEQIIKLESQVTERTEELDRIKNDLKENNIIVNDQAKIIESISKENDYLKNLVQKLANEKDALEISNQQIGQELVMTKDKLIATEQCKEMMGCQLDKVTGELEECKEKFTVQSNVANDLTGRIAHLEYEKSTQELKTNQTKEVYEEKINQLNGSLYVLRVAHNSLEARLKSNDQRRDSTDKEAEAHRKLIEALQNENAEYKERIRYGAMEYSKVYEKMRFYKNQIFKSELNTFGEPESNQVRRRQPFSTSSQSDLGSESNTQTNSQSARASADDSENTLLDALLGSSFYNGTWNGSKKQANNEEILVKTPATTTQPIKTSDFSSDDGLIKAKHVVEKQQINNLAQKISRCQIGQAVQEQDPKLEDCEICHFIFPTGAVEEERKMHKCSHYGQSCPVCFLEFSKGFNQNQFEMHVNSHFTN